MDMQFFTDVPNAARIVIKAKGDLRVQAHDAREIRVEGEAEVRQKSNGYEIDVRRPCTAYVPADSFVTIEYASRDVNIHGVMGDIMVEEIDDRGNLTLSDVGSVKINEVGRNVVADRVHGDLAAEEVGGNVDLRDAMGNVRLNEVGGNVTAERIMGDLKIEEAGGNVALESVSGSIQIEDTGGNLIARGVVGAIMVEDVGGNATIDGSSPITLGDIGGNLTVRGATELSVSDIGGDCVVSGVLRGAHADIGGNFDGREAVLAGGVELDVGGNAHVAIDPQPGETYVIEAGGNVWCQLSDGAQAELDIEDGRGNQRFSVGSDGAEVRLECGGTVEISGAANVDVRQAAFDNGRKMGKFKVKLPKIPSVPTPPLPGLSNLGADIRAEVERAMRQANDALRGAQIEISTEIERGMREGFGDKKSGPARGTPGWSGERDNARTAQPQSAPASDEEQQVILRMLAEKKITVEQADQLLRALQGGQA
jgi:hypothetical protein